MDDLESSERGSRGDHFSLSRFHRETTSETLSRPWRLERVLGKNGTNFRRGLAQVVQTRAGGAATTTRRDLEFRWFLSTVSLSRRWRTLWTIDREWSGKIPRPVLECVGSLVGPQISGAAGKRTHSSFCGELGNATIAYLFFAEGRRAARRPLLLQTRHRRVPGSEGILVDIFRNG